MASADADTAEGFLSHVDRVRREIQTQFERAHKMLQEREADLLTELQRLVGEYTGERITQQIKQLLISKDALKDTLTENENKEFLDLNLASIDARVKELEIKFQTTRDTYRSVSLVWSVELDNSLMGAGDIQLNAVRGGTRDYKAIGGAIAVFGRHNIEKGIPGAFCYPNDIAINPVNKYIYICDSGYNRVQVYNRSFEYVFQFSEKMKGPAGICIQHNKAYVTQFHSHCLNVYSTEGLYLTSVGEKGKKELEFNGPRGLDVSTEKGRIYVTELYNYRVQCLNLDLKFNSLIDDISGAKDVKLTSEQIVVLSGRSPCVALYTYSHQLIREMIPRGQGSHILSASYFILDESFNVVITDNESHSVCVFTFGGEFVHKFGREGRGRGDLKEPSGVSFDADGRVIVVSENPEHCVQLF